MTFCLFQETVYIGECDLATRVCFERQKKETEKDTDMEREKKKRGMLEI